jgi:hypothetical protein
MRGSPLSKNQPYRHASAADKMLAWPAVQNALQPLLNADVDDLHLQTLEAEGMRVRGKNATIAPQ